MNNAPPRLAIEFGQILGKARQDAGLSLRALASQVGVSNVTLVGYEHGRSNLTVRQMEEVASWYGIEVAVIRKLTDTGNR